MNNNDRYLSQFRIKNSSFILNLLKDIITYCSSNNNLSIYQASNMKRANNFISKKAIKLEEITLLDFNWNSVQILKKKENIYILQKLSKKIRSYLSILSILQAFSEEHLKKKSCYLISTLRS
jgi:hypothetical protein